MTYATGDSPVHRCDARVKIVILLVFSIAIFFVKTRWGMGAFALAVAVVVAVARLSPAVLNRMLIPVYVLTIYAVLVNLAFSPSVDTLLSGLFLFVRVIVLVTASFVMCLTSSSSDLLEAFRWFISPLERVGIPVDDIAFTLALSLRFIPVIEGEFAAVRAAQKARGADFKMPVSRKLKVWANAFLSIFVSLFRHASTLSDAMEARCYGVGSKRTRLSKSTRS